MLFSRASRDPRGRLRVLKSARLPLAALLLLFTAAAARAATVTVPAGADLQAALDQAQPGDTLVLAAGATFVGPFTLPAKGGSDWITIRGSAPDSVLPPDGARVTPAHSPFMPKIVTPGNAPALRTAAGAHHYRFVGVEFRPVSGATNVWNLIELGRGDESQSTLDVVPHHLVLDRCYVHGDPAGVLVRGVALNSAHTDIVNSHISDVKVTGYDSQAVMGWNGPGPFRIVNNYLEAAGENVMFGGSDPAIPNLVPSDIEVRRNHMFKPPAWRGAWTVKNLFELKNARRVVVEGNLFENNWANAQNGFAILFTVRNQYGAAPWSTVEDVLFTNNVVRGAGGGVNILGRDNNHPSQQVSRVTIKNNLFEDLSAAWGGQGNFLQITEARDVTVDHNTILHTGNATFAYGVPTEGLVFTNNLLAHNDYGVFGDGAGYGSAAIGRYFPSAVFARNLVAGAPDWAYPAGNFYPASLDLAGFVARAAGDYRLSPASPYRAAGTDGKDLGCDFDALAAARGGSASNPAPTPTPAPSPTALPAASGSALFVGADSATQGNWKGTYGSAGYQIVNDAAAYPAYARVSADGRPYTWVGSTDDARALQRAAAGDRIAATWFDGDAMTIDVSLTDGQPRRVSLYCLDWDRQGRSESIEVLDAATGSVLDSRTVSSFAQGQYLVWEVRGHVKLRVKRLAGHNAIVSGIFFDDIAGAGPTPTPTPTATPTPTPTATPTPTPTPLTSPALVAAAHAEAVAVAANTAATDEQLASVAASIERAYAVFAAERGRIAGADQIEKALRASYYFSRAAEALAWSRRHPTGVVNRVQITAARLGQARALLSSAGGVAPAGDLAHPPAAMPPTVIGSAATVSAATLKPLVSPLGLADLAGETGVSPLSGGTERAARLSPDALSFELGGASVTVAGRAAPLLYVSPSRLSFIVPAGVPAGEAEVIVTSQDGYVSRGSVTVAALAPGLFARDAAGAALLMEASTRSAADSFDVLTQANLGGDKRTRLSLFATGLAADSVLNTDPANDVPLAAPAVLPNLAESVTAEARTGDGRTLALPVEYAGGVAAGIAQVTVVLVPELRGAGRIELTISVAGHRSNTVTVAVK